MENAGSILLVKGMFSVILIFVLVIRSIRIAKLKLVLTSTGIAKLKVQGTRLSRLTKVRDVTQVHLNNHYYWISYEEGC